MVNQQVLEGKWQEVRGKIKEKWGKLSDDDLRTFSGNVDQLVGQIQRKTGESRQVIEDFLGEVAEGASSATAQVRDMAQQGVDMASEGFRQGYETLRERYGDAERAIQDKIQDRPAQSVAIAFGVGLAAGVGLALLCRERPSESTMARGRAAAEHIGQQLVDALHNMMPRRA